MSEITNTVLSKKNNGADKHQEKYVFTDYSLIEAKFHDSISYLYKKLERIDFLVQHYLRKLEVIFSSSDVYRGLYITSHDAHKLLNKPIGEPWWLTSCNNEDVNDLESCLDKIDKDIETKKAELLSHGVSLRLEELKNIFHLNDFEIDIILIALAVEIDLRYEIVFAYLQDDISKKYPTVELVLNLLGRSPAGRSDIRKFFAAESVLVRSHIIELVDDPAKNYGGLLSKIVKLPKRIIEYLMNETSIEKKIDLCVKQADVLANNIEEVLHPDIYKSVTNLLPMLADDCQGNVLHLTGKYESGKLDIAVFLSKKRNRELLQIDVAAIPYSNIKEFILLNELILREAKLRTADIYYSNFKILFEESKSQEKQALFSVITDFDGLVTIDECNTLNENTLVKNKNNYYLSLKGLSNQHRASIWNDLLIKQNTIIDENELIRLSDRFRFSPGQIYSAMKIAEQLTSMKRSRSTKPDLDLLYEACRLTINQKLNKHAKRISTLYGWDDLILNKDELFQLKQLVNTVLNRNKVFSTWGFGNKLSLGKGINALFTGLPGTGKTMAAEIIANNLGIELYKIDLSSVISKYIGETEKNLSKIFQEAETSSAILFFDEADALFGKRTEISNSHDRYANIEVAYLLQRMEEYEGITILATNLRKNIDDAFSRRLSFIINFPFPEEEERRKIWQKIWPNNIPLSEDLDLKFMAETFKLAGGNIKNIALSASFLAAAEECNVEMQHLLIATKQELKKLGRSCVRLDFGKYADLLQ